MNKKRSIIWITVFLLVIIAPTFVAFVVGNGLDSTNYENRIMASLPEISIDNYEEFSKEFENYYNDNLPFRNELINLNSKISYYGFRDSSSDKVLVGQEEWLFYMDGGVQSSTGQWQWENYELERIAENLSNAKKYLEHEGIELVVFIAPNKETVYKDKLPDNYPIISEKTRGEVLVEYLRENTDVNVLFPVEELRNVREEHETYLQFDTHWNNLGAYLGAKLINEQLGIKMPELEEIEFEKIVETRGDLARMLHLSFDGRGENYDFKEYDDEMNEFQDSTFMERHNENGDERVVLVQKDSFGVRLSQYLAPEYQDAYFVSNEVEKYIKELKPDVLVYEVIERNSGAMGLRLKFVEMEINNLDDKKEICFSATTSNPLEYVSVFKSKNGSQDVEVIQVLQPLKEMKLEATREETGEFYIYIFKDAEGQNVMKEMVIPY